MIKVRDKTDKKAAKYMKLNGKNVVVTVAIYGASKAAVETAGYQLTEIK